MSTNHCLARASRPFRCKNIGPRKGLQIDKLFSFDVSTLALDMPFQIWGLSSLSPRMEQSFLCLLSPLPVSSGTNFPLLLRPRGDCSHWCATFSGEWTSLYWAGDWLQKAAGAQRGTCGNAVKRGEAVQSKTTSLRVSEQGHGERGVFLY